MVVCKAGIYEVGDRDTRRRLISPKSKVSMDGRGRAKGNIWIERSWKTIKYEYIYNIVKENGAGLYQGIKRFIDDYDFRRRH